MTVNCSTPSRSRGRFQPGRGKETALITQLQFRRIITGALTLSLLLACASRSASAGQEFELQTVSSRRNVVSGGNVLVQLSAPNDATWVAQLNGRDVTHVFRPAEGSRNWRALLTGLNQGENILAIRVNGNTRSKLAIVDHPHRRTRFLRTASGAVPLPNYR